MLMSPVIIHLKINDDIPGIVRPVLMSYKEKFEKLIIYNGSKKNPCRYYNMPCAFDIETSSFYKDGEKQACMYIWQFGVCGLCFTGRTWEQFKTFVQVLRECLDLSPELRLFVGVHNLSYEFQFIRKWFTWENVFAIDSRKVAYGVTTDGLEFRCTYILTGKSLETVGHDLREIKVEKLHTLDYKLIRTSETEISDAEMNYCINDILVVMGLIYEKMLQDGNVAKIALTKTSYVRRLLKKECLYSGSNNHKQKNHNFTKYRRLMQALTLDGYKEYKLLKEAFMGGFTHSNPKKTDMVLPDFKHPGKMSSIDFTSAYPFVMIACNRFPMSKGTFVRPRTKSEFEHNIKYYACVFEIELFDVEATFFNDFYIPASKCRLLLHPVISNGRVVSADHLIMTMTEVDYDIIRRTYRWDESKTKTGYFVRYRRGFLPTAIVRCILQLYKDKTELKDVEGKEEYYQLRKELLNSCFGCICTDICRPENIYEDDEWKEPTLKDFEELIEAYNNKKDRVLFYPWALYVTALNRWNLWSGILEFRDDYVYSDTDSIKGQNLDKHMRYIENYNRHCKVLLKEAMDYHGLDLADCHPLTIKKQEKWLGVWDDEGFYFAFKTLGAKRYAFMKKGKFSITVSGLNKKVAAPYLICKYKEKLFDAFDDDMYIPAEYTGKLCHTYIDDECSGEITDYQGHTAAYYEKSFIHLDNEDYSLSISDQFLDLLTKIRERADSL